MPLAFSVFSPTFAIAGLLLAAVPIIIHLLNRRRYKTVQWAAMDFLLRAMRKNRQRVRFEQLLLLATRCCVVALLGLALARPIGCNSQSSAALGGKTGLHVFVIDNGYPMAYRPGRTGGLSHLEQSKKIAGGIIDHLARGGESVVVITAGKPSAAVAGKPVFDLQQARGMIDRLPQTYAATDLTEALKMAAAVGHDQEKQPNKNLYVFTAATAAAWQSSDAAALKTIGADLGHMFRVVHFNMATGPQWNQTVTELKPSNPLVTTNNDFGSDFVATVRGFGTSHEATLQWKLDGKLLPGGGKVQPTTDTPPQTEPQTQMQTVLRAGGTHVLTAAVIGDDKLPADDTRARVINVVSQLKVLIVEGQHGVGADAGSALNLQAALAGVNKEGKGEGVAEPEIISDLELGNRPLADYRAVMMSSVSRVTAAEADQLAAFVNNGGTLMWFLGDDASDESYNTQLLPRRLMPGQLTKKMLSFDKGYHFAFNPHGVLHPLLRAFAQENTGLENAQTFGYWQVDAPTDPAMRVLNFAPLEGTKVDPTAKPDPAILTWPVGRGHVVLMTTAATEHEKWITWTRKQVYTELMNELLTGSVDAGDGWMNLSVGDRLVVPSTIKLTATPTLVDPKSAAIPLEQVTSPDGSSAYRSGPLAEPGVYTLTTGGGPVPIAVNVPPDAADVRTVDDNAIKTALGGIDLQLNDDQPVREAFSNTGSDQGWNVMVIVLILVAVEAFLAMRFGHFKRAA